MSQLGKDKNPKKIDSYESNRMQSLKLFLLLLIKSLSIRLMRSLTIMLNLNEIDARSLDNDGVVAAVPLITDSLLNITTKQIRKGDVYTTLQCMSLCSSNQCN
jgi:hypothetical protein